MNCSQRNCQFCWKNKEESHRSLALPTSIMSFAPFNSVFFPTVSTTLQEIPSSHIHHPIIDYKNGCISTFTAIHGFSIKPEEDQSAKMAHSKLNFSVESITSGNFSSPAINKGQSILLKSRGRPSADSIHLLKQKSLEHPYRYKCCECGRSFPRKKSLDTHKLTHSDIKPYACDFPGCRRRFKQSGQLKTHLRLHTGEKPFRCTFPFCTTSFTHANRKCPQHPEYPLHRVSTDEVLSPNIIERVIDINCADKKVDSESIKKWLEKQFTNRQKNEYSFEEKSGYTVLHHDENMPPEEIPKGNDCMKPNIANEETNRRLLSAVALMELRNQMRSTERKENFRNLFSMPEN